MSDHIPNVTKMIGDTPRSNAAQWIADDGSGGIHSVVSLCEARKLERELNRLNDRIRRLEKAGDAMETRLHLRKNISDQFVYKGDAESVENWNKAKEDKL